MNTILDGCLVTFAVAFTTIVVAIAVLTVKAVYDEFFY